MSTGFISEGKSVILKILVAALIALPISGPKVVA
jgi:hypothetical protein